MNQFVDILIRVLADFLVIPIILIGVWTAFRLPQEVRFRKIARGVVSGLVALLLAKIASLLYQGERPFVLLGMAPKAAYLPNPGFPSDHVLLVFTITFVVWAMTKDTRLSLILLALSMLVAFGRLLALVHTPIDVLGGVACAFVAVVLVYGGQFFIRHLPDKQSLK